MPLALRFNDGLDGDLQAPQLEWHMLSGVGEVLVRREQCKLVPPAELDQQRVDRSYLYTCASTGVTDLCRSNVVLPVWVNEWERSEPLDDGFRCAWPVEPLEKFLKYKPGGYD